MCRAGESAALHNGGWSAGLQPALLQGRYTREVNLSALPGADLILKGLEDLRQHRVTEAALLVMIGAERLRRAGIDVPATSVENPEHALYGLLANVDPDSAHSRYNALVRQLVSFERAAECAA
jgi:hypothetical protein